MASAWGCLMAVAAIVAVLAVIDALTDGKVSTKVGGPLGLGPCPFGAEVVLRSSATGGNLIAVGQQVFVAPPSPGSEGQTWRIYKAGDHLLIHRATGGSLQDVAGRVGMDIEGPGTHKDRWWVEQKDGVVGLRLLSDRQMYLKNVDGRVEMNDKLGDKTEQASWGIFLPDGRPAFESKCWERKKKDRTLNDGWVPPHKQTPDYPPQPSFLANYSWKPFYKVTEEDIKFYDEHGFVLLKQVVEPQVMDILYEEAKFFCKDQIERRNVCQIEMLRWQLNTFRDFLFYGPLGPVVHQFMRASGVRVSTEALFGTVFNKQDPPFFSYQYHTDAGNQFGVFHGFATGTPAAAAWFPLHDVDAEVTGGGIKVIDGYPWSPCKWRNCNGMVIGRGPKAPKEYYCPEDCHQTFRMLDCGSNGCKNCAAQKVLSFKKGDIVVWHSDMPHATQSTKLEGFERYAFTVRFVDSDAVMCDPAGSCGGWMACCKDTPTVAGQKIHSHCYPQLHPQVLEHEVKAHHSMTPKFMIADPVTEARISKTVPSSDCHKPANARDYYA